MAPKSKHGGFYYGYVIVAVLVLTSFIPVSLGLSCAGVFYPVISQDLGVSTGKLSYYVSFIWIAALVTLPVLGKLLATRDARWCLTGAVALFVVAFIWLGFTRSLWQIYVGGFIIGIGIAMLLFLALSTLINRWFLKRAGFFLGIVMAFTGVGGVVFSTVGGILIQNIGWSNTYFAFAALCALVLPFTALLVRSRPEDKGLMPFGYSESDQPEKAASQGVAADKAYRMPAFFLILAACFTLNMGMPAYFMIPSYSATLPAAAAIPLLGATASSAAMAGQTISKLVLGAIGDKRTYSGIISGISLGILGIAGLAMGGSSAVLIYAASFSFGFFYGVTNVMMPILTRRTFGDRDYAQIYSRVSMVASIANIAGAFLWGATVDATGGYTVLFAGSLIFMAITIILTVVINRQNRKKPQA